MNKEINFEKKKKVLIFDSSSIITLNLINLLNLLEKLKLNFNGEFLITEEVYKEIVRVPLGIKKYELKALMTKKIIEKGIIKLIKSNEIEKKTQEILEKANRLFSVKGQSIKLIHRGEASCIALYELLPLKNQNKVIVIDERTTRMIVEKPLNLKLLLENKLHTKINANENLMNWFEKKKINLLRSSELLLIALKQNKIELKNDLAFLIDALLYGAKAYGCAIAKEEIEKIKKNFKNILG